MTSPRAPLADVADYYARKLELHGIGPQGVDWNGEAGQTLRFAQLSRIIAPGEPFSINDLGCGYGALHRFLRDHNPSFDYAGFDVSATMLDAARGHLGEAPGIRLALGSEPDRIADYGVASGIFNVRLGCCSEDWRGYVERTLEALDRTSRLGFAFNCLTSYSDPERMRENLYYADPCVWFDLCKRRFSRDVALLHDYELYEFTILVRKRP